MISEEITEKNDSPAILFIHMAGLGDGIMASPSLALLKSNLPKWRLLVLARTQVIDYFNSLPFVDEVIPFVDNKWLDKKPHTLLVALFLYLKLLAKIHSLDCKAVIEWRGQLVDSIMSYSTSAPLRVGSVSRLTPLKVSLFTKLIRRWNLPLEEFNPLITNIVDCRENCNHLVDLMLAVSKETISQINQEKPEENNLVMSIPIQDQDNQVVSSLLQDNSIRQREEIVAISVGSRTKGNSWNPKNFALVGDYLQNKLDKKVILTGLASQKYLEEEIIKNMTTKPIPTCGKLSLNQLAALYQRCCLVITLNSASMHIAAAVKTPIVVLLGRDGESHSPWQTNYTYVTKNPFYPQSHPHPKQWPELVHNINTEEVIVAINKILEPTEIMK